MQDQLLNFCHVWMCLQLHLQCFTYGGRRQDKHKHHQNIWKPLWYWPSLKQTANHWLAILPHEDDWAFKCTSPCSCASSICTAYKSLINAGDSNHGSYDGRVKMPKIASWVLESPPPSDKEYLIRYCTLLNCLQMCVWGWFHPLNKNKSMILSRILLANRQVRAICNNLDGTLPTPAPAHCSRFSIT
jgi:hypothetical protein